MCGSFLKPHWNEPAGCVLAVQWPSGCCLTHLPGLLCRWLTLFFLSDTSLELEISVIREWMTGRLSLAHALCGRCSVRVVHTLLRFTWAWAAHFFQSQEGSRFRVARGDAQVAQFSLAVSVLGMSVHSPPVNCPLPLWFLVAVETLGSSGKLLNPWFSSFSMIPCLVYRVTSHCCRVCQHSHGACCTAAAREIHSLRDSGPLSQGFAVTELSQAKAQSLSQAHCEVEGAGVFLFCC